MQQPAPFRGSTSGLSRQRLRTPRLRRESRDVYVLAERRHTPDLAVQAAPVGVPDAVVSHATAAAWLGLPGPRDRRVHLTRSRAAGVSARRGVVTHRSTLPETHVVVHRDVRVTSPARTWLDLAPVLPFPELVALGDAVARRTGIGALEAVLRGGSGRRGVVSARAALELVDPGADSPPETLCRLLLHEAGFRGLRHGVVVRDHLGGCLSVPDLADPDDKVAVQYDGLHHLQGDPWQRRNDIDRDEVTRAAGWEVVVLTAKDLQLPALAILKVRAAYERAAARRA